MNEPSAFQSFLAVATQLLSWCLDAMSSIITTIVSEPVLLIGFLIMLVSLAFGLVFRTAGQR